jgi:hypothetical protein
MVRRQPDIQFAGGAQPNEESYAGRRPVSPYPHTMQPVTPDRESAFDRAYADRLFKQIQSSLDDIAQYYVDITNRVDEFRPQSLSGESMSVTTWQPDYECDEIITTVIVTGPSGIPGSSTPANGGPIAAPGAGTVIASTPSFPAGEYNVAWTVEVEGTLAVGTDDNNFQLRANAATAATSINPALAGTYPQASEEITLTSAGTFVVRNNLAGTAGSQYSAQIVVTPITQNFGTPFELSLGRRNWQLNLPTTGILVIPVTGIKMARDSVRQLTSAFSGDWAVELIGYAETGRRGRV